MKLFGERVNYKVKYQRRVGAYGIILQKNDLILTEQITKENGIELQLPGGGSNENESLIRALYREVIEETGWGIKVLKKNGVLVSKLFMGEDFIEVKNLAKSTFKVVNFFKPVSSRSESKETYLHCKSLKTL